MNNNLNEGACCGDDCCGGSAASGRDSAEAVREKVREGYGQIARSGQWSGVSATGTQPQKAEGGCCGSGGGCCGPTTVSAEDVAAAVGYSAAELASVPEGANMGLSCGNPTAIASLKPGEVVLDLGSGGGFDCFVAGPRVGASGRVIGVDMTPEMVSKARKNLAAYRRTSGLDNVEFRIGEIEHLPVADASVDVVISNCVLNLSSDKAQVWREIARVLKPGGRVAISDLALVRELPEAVQQDVEALVGCVAGAALLEDMRRMIEETELQEITLDLKPEYIDSMTQWQDPLYKRVVANLPAGSKASDFVTSVDVFARKRGVADEVRL